MYNYVMGSYKKQEYNPSSMPSLSPTISPILGPMLTRQPSFGSLKLPDINNDKRKPLPGIVNCCVSCNIHRSQGCTNNIKKNGNKIWYVLHNLVESIKRPKMTNEEFEIMCTTIVTIIRSVPCRECAGHSLLWYKSVVKNNTKLQTRIHLIYEVWKHHDDVTKRLLMMNPSIIIKRLTWNEYKNQIEINRITCGHMTVI
jgi:hypothetical protein